MNFTFTSKRRTLSFIFSILLLTSYGQVNQFEWVVETSRNRYVDFEFPKNQLMEVDTAGNVFLIINTPPTPLTVGDTTVNIIADMCLAKIDKTGHTEWVHGFDGDGNSLTVDEAGDCYAVGRPDGLPTFNGVTFDTSATRGGFVLKVHSNGSLAWGKIVPSVDDGDFISVTTNQTSVHIGGKGENFYTQLDKTTGNILQQTSSSLTLSADKIVGDSFGSIYFSSMIRDNSSTAPISIGSFSFTPTFSSSSILIKQDSMGNISWIKELGNDNAFLYIRNIAIDNSNNLLLYGRVFDSLQLSPNHMIYNNSGFTHPNGLSDNFQYFIAKYDVNSNLTWVKKLTLNNFSPSLLSASPLDTDKEDNIYITQVAYDKWIDNYQIGPANIGTCSVIKLDSSGNTTWVKTIKGYSKTPQALAVQGDNIYLHGKVYNDSIEAMSGKIVAYSPPQPAPYMYPNANFIIKMTNTWGSHSVDGVMFYDNNGDGIQNAQDTGVSYGIVDFNNGSYKSTDINGKYTAYLPDGNYTISGSLPPYWIQTTPDTTINFSGNWQNVPSFKIGIQEIPNVQDLQINIASTPIRPGFDMSYFVTYKNIGTTTMSGQVELLLDDTLNYLNSEPMGVYNNSLLTWNYANLAPGESRVLRVNCNMPATLGLLGTNLMAVANIQPIANDTTPSNNYITYNQVVADSHAPNDKQVSPVGAVDTNFVKDGTFTYLIRFQNTGNDTAFTVRVTDILDERLDISTFEMIGASHQYDFELTNRSILWTFNNILLPDSTTNEPESHGFIQYKIRPKPATQLNDTITNTARIYFDFNPAIITNTTISSVEILTNTSKVTVEQVETINVFPNPTHGWITCEIEDFQPNEQYVFKVFDMQGRQVRQEDMNTARQTMNLEGLPAGMYVFQVVNSQNSLKGVGKILVR